MASSRERANHGGDAVAAWILLPFHLHKNIVLRKANFRPTRRMAGHARKPAFPTSLISPQLRKIKLDYLNGSRVNRTRLANSNGFANIPKFPVSMPETPPRTESPISSPFGDRSASVATVRTGAQRRRKRAIILAIGSLSAVAAILISFFWLRDPLRTLPEFPATDYISSYKGLVGANFKAELVVDAELGWNEENGRLMSFKVSPSAQTVAVLIPPKLAKEYFIKGRSYKAEVVVREDGLLVAKQLARK